MYVCMYVWPFGRTNGLKKFINELNTAHSPKERKDYLIEYSGFSNIYKTTLVSADEHHDAHMGSGTKF